MESTIVGNVDATTEASTSSQVESCSPPQEKIHNQTKSLTSLQHMPHVSMDSDSDSFCTPKKRSSHEAEEMELEMLEKSPKSNSSSKHCKLTPSKGLKNIPKRLFKSPSRSKEIKTCALKRQHPKKILADESDVKSHKAQDNNSGNGECSLSKYNDISDSLEQKATKIRMTAKNVRSVIHHVLKNEHVLSIFRDALASEQPDVPGQSSPMKEGASDNFDSLPKMTRAKVREFLEKISMPSPVKTTKEGPSILDVEFNEEEEDDEYNPEKDEECHESDDESVTSSKLSEFGSPYRDVPSTPVMTPLGDGVISGNIYRETTTETQTNSDVVSTSAANIDDVQAIGTESKDTTDEVGTIAFRTRSKLPLTSTTITKIESAFVAPDITTDMYDNICDDADWVQFLSSLYKPHDDTVTDDDADANDPEFNYIAEAEREQLDEEDFRFDKPTQIPKKEMTALINELSDLFEDEVLPYQAVANASSEVAGSKIPQSYAQDMPSTSTSDAYHNTPGNVPSLSSSTFTEFKTPQGLPSHNRIKNSNFGSIQIIQPPLEQPCAMTPSYNNRISVANSVVTPEQRELIEDNIRKEFDLLCQQHTQLLLQSFMLCQNSPLLTQITDVPKSMILELTCLRQSSSAGENSVFNVCNLGPAVELVSDLTLFENSEAERSSGFGWNVGSEPRSMLSHTQKLVIYNSPAFVYPQLLPLLKKLPLQKKLKENDKKGSKFCNNEDNLIALGLEQFQACPNESPIDLILKLLIRGKSREQIFHHVQYMSSGRGGDNPIKYVKKYGKLPSDFPKPTLDNFYQMAPKDQSSLLLPTWCSSLKYSRIKTSLSKSGVQCGLSVSVNESVTKEMPVLPAPTDQLPQQGNPELRPMSIQYPQKHLEQMQQSASPHFQPPQNISQVSPSVTMQSSAAVQLPTDLPQITGIYIQFAAPLSTVAHNSAAITLPTLAPKSATVCELNHRNSTSHYPSKSSKRKAPSSSDTLISKKKTVNRTAPKDWNTQPVINISTQTDGGASSDLLAKTMLSCGIEESSSCSSPQPQFLYNNDLVMAFTSSTPIDQDKHPSVRNLNWEFDAAHRQSVCSTVTPKVQDTDKTAPVYSEVSSMLTSAPQSFFARSETSAVHEHRLDCMPLIALDDSGTSSNTLTEQTANINNTNEEGVLHRNSPAMTQYPSQTANINNTNEEGVIHRNSPAMTQYPSQTANINNTNEEGVIHRNSPAMTQYPSQTANINNTNEEGTLHRNLPAMTQYPSQTANINNTNEEGVLHRNSPAMTHSDPLCDVPKQIMPSIGDFCDNHDFHSQSEISFNAPLLVESETLKADQEKQPPPTTDQEKQPPPTTDQKKQPPPTTDQEKQPPPTTDQEKQPPPTTDQKKQPPPTTDQEKQPPLTTDQGSIQEHEPTRDHHHSCDFPSQSHLLADASPPLSHSYTSPSEDMDIVVSDPASTCIDHSGKETSRSILDLHPVQPDAVCDKSNSSNSAMTDLKTDEGGIFPLVKSICSDSGDKTNISVSAYPESVSENNDFKTLAKPKTIKQILEASKRKKAHCNKELFTSNSSIMEHDVSSFNLNMVNTNDNTSQLTENPKTITPEHEITVLIEGSGTSSSSEQQTEKSPPDGGTVALSPINTITLITFHSPAKSLAPTDRNIASPFKTPTKLRPIVAKARSPSSCSSSPYVPLPKMSPKRKELNRHVRQILPKSFVFEIKSPSPTKAAAQVLKRKATMFCQNRSPIKLLPKQPLSASSGVSRPRPLLTPSRMFTRSQKTSTKNSGVKAYKEARSPVVKETPPEKELTEKSELTEAEDAALSQEEEEEEFEDEDQSQLDDLMAACTTIGYDPNKGASGIDSDNKSKAQKRRDICLSMLEPDIIDRDPKKDERDTAYAQHYFTLVKQVLSNDPERFKKFLTILHDMNKNHMNPIELFADMATLLSEHQDLVQDFAGFLLAFQAVECKCFVSCLEYQQILTFLRRLEIYCDSSNLTYQRTLKMMSRWLTLFNQESVTDTNPFKERIAAVLRHVPNIMDDLLSYFFGTALPDSHHDDFEEVNLVEDAVGDVDEFEEITLPESQEYYNTKLCSCQCHQDQQDEKLRRRIKHCFSCSLKIFNGKPILKTSHSVYRPITVLYPLEEKEKMMKAKKEAAQLALAKARAQRQQNKKKNKKRKLDLKCKNSKSISVKRKFKKRQRYTSPNSSQEAGNISKSINESENKKSDVRDGLDVLSPKQEKPDLKKISFTFNNEHLEVCDRALTETSTDITDSTISCQSVGSTEGSTEQSSQLLTMDTVDINEQVAIKTHKAEETNPLSSLTSTLENEPSVSNKDILVKGCAKNLISHFSEPSVSRTAPTLNLAGQADSCEPGSAPATPFVRTGNLDSSLMSSDLPSNIPSHPQTVTSQSNNSQPVPTIPLSCLSPVMTVSQTISLNCPEISSSHSHTTTPIANVNRTVKPVTHSTLPYQNTEFLQCNIEPRYTSSPIVSSTRIPVIVTLNPQQYLPSSSQILPQMETHKPGKKSPERSILTTSLSSSHQINTVESTSDKRENCKQEQGSNFCVISSDPAHLQQSFSNPKPSFASSSKDIETCIVPQGVGPPVTKIADAGTSDLKSSSSVTNFTNIPNNFSSSYISTIDANASSSTRLDSAVDFQQSNTTFNFPTTPVKGKVPTAVGRAYLDSFSLGAFEGSIGFNQLQQIAQAISPHKLLTDSMTKFDLLALLESSNTGYKDMTLQSGSESSTLRTTSEPLLTFSGALAKLTATSEEPALASLTTKNPKDLTTCVKAEDLLPSGVSKLHDQANIDHVTDEESNSDSINEKEEKILKDMCPQLNSTDVLMNDESSNAFELSVWTEEQDRAILNIITVEGVTGVAVRKLHSELPEKSSEEISSRARLLLRMLEDMGDTESDTGTEASHDDQSEQEI